VSNGNPPNSPAPTTGLSNLVDRFIVLVAGLPPAGRLVVLLAALGIGGTLAYLRYARPVPTNAQPIAKAEASAGDYSDRGVADSCQSEPQ